MSEIYRTLLRNYYVKKVQQYTVFGESLKLYKRISEYFFFYI